MRRVDVAVALALTLPVAGALEAQTAPVRLVESGTVGCLMCEGPEAFGAVQALAVGTDGSIWVADRDEPMIRRIAPDGRLAASFGRAGEGPGKLGMLSGMGVLSDGTVLVSDFRRAYLQRFDREGEPLATIPLGAAALGVAADARGRSAAWQTRSYPGVRDRTAPVAGRP